MRGMDRDCFCSLVAWASMCQSRGCRLWCIDSENSRGLNPKSHAMLGQVCGLLSGLSKLIRNCFDAEPLPQRKWCSSRAFALSENVADKNGSTQWTSVSCCVIFGKNYFAIIYKSKLGAGGLGPRKNKPWVSHRASPKPHVVSSESVNDWAAYAIDLLINKPITFMDFRTLHRFISLVCLRKKTPCQRSIYYSWKW